MTRRPLPATLIATLVAVSTACAGSGAPESKRALAADPARAEHSAESKPGFVIMGAKIFDGEQFRTGNVEVRGGTIAGFVDRAPPGAAVIAGAGKTLLPGLMDGHIHIGDKREHLRRSLSFGVTTVVDLFGPPELISRLRAEEGTPAARDRAALFGAGNLATAPRGHGTEYGIPVPTLERPEEAGAFVRERKKEGSDLLKIVFDNTANPTHPEEDMPTLSIETVRALVRAGHEEGLRVAVHAGTCDDLRKLAETGADILAHGCAMKEGDALPKLLADKKVFFNPTLAVQLRPCGLEYWIPMVNDPELAPKFTDEERERLGKDRKDHNTECSKGRMRLVGEAAKLGVRLVAGPDSPNRRIPVGASLLAEVELLRQSGATTAQALAAATSNVADAYGLTDRGRIAKGKRADLLLVEGDVEAEPTALWHARTVFRGGEESWRR